jgi:prophage regulatory protein
MARNIIRKRRVLERTGFSDTTIWRLEKAGSFPKRLRLTEAGAVGWYEDEVDDWIRSRLRGTGNRPPPKPANSCRPRQ